MSLRRPIQITEGLLQLLDFVLKLVFDYVPCLNYINGTNTTPNLLTSLFRTVLCGVSIVQVNGSHFQIFLSSISFSYLFSRSPFPLSKYSVEIRWLHCESQLVIFTCQCIPYHCPPWAEEVKLLVDQESHKWQLIVLLIGQNNLDLCLFPWTKEVITISKGHFC